MFSVFSKVKIKEGYTTLVSMKFKKGAVARLKNLETIGGGGKRLPFKKGVAELQKTRMFVQFYFPMGASAQKNEC